MKGGKGRVFKEDLRKGGEDDVEKRNVHSSRRGGSKQGRRKRA